ncbi:MAG: hypothetical protein KAH44_13415, partial [Oricola sp.]|nr:hypothetical protein [Oricola sp.]
LNGDGATGDTDADGEGSLLDVDIVAPLDGETLAEADGLGDALDGVETEVTLGGDTTVDPVDLADDAIDGADEILDAAEDLLDVDSLLSPLEDAVDGAVDLIDAQEGETDLSLDVSDAGEIGGELIGDIIIDDGDGLVSDLGDGLDLPDPDAVLSEGLPLVDEGLSGLVGGGGGLFG